MIQRVLEFDIRSFLIVLIAFIGNGRAFGIDVVLVLICMAVILQLRDSWVIQRRALPFFFLITVLLFFAALRSPSIGIPYNVFYGLWPFKALLLFILVSCNRKDLMFPMGNMLLLALICVALVLVGRIEDGRLVSIFGPNMLYRIFCFLLFFSIIWSFGTKGGARLLQLAFSAFALYAALLTGSNGALLVIIIVVVVVVWRIFKGASVIQKSVLVLVAIAAFSFVNFFEMIPGIETGFDNVETFSRAAYLLASFETSARLTGWTEILVRPFSFIGQSHVFYENLWSFEYDYPHNIFLELYAFYGGVGVALVAVLVTAITKAIAVVTQGDIMAMTFIVIIIGANVSGDMSDNYGAIGLAAGLLARSAIRSTDRRQ